MLISVFTPVHPKSLPYLEQAYRSLLAQTYTDFEWVVLTNGGVTPDQVAAVCPDDDRVHIISVADDAEHNYIGRLKRTCCEVAGGEVLVELDADDMLTPDALQVIADTFANDNIHFAYSNDAEFHDGSWEPHVYGAYWGWQQQPFEYGGRDLVEMIGFKPDHNTMRRIEWAPNHVRCWRRDAYWLAGGHNPEIKTGDDHDLVCRTFIMSGPRRFVHINRCLYLYRLHGLNSCVTNNAEVQERVAINYGLYYERMSLKWAQEWGLLAIDLGGGINKAAGYISVDQRGGDIEADLSKRWPLNDSSVGVLRASHCLEHMADSIHTMNEAYRVLAPGGVFLIESPSTDGRGAFQDPTHKSFWNENSFWYYCRDTHARFIPDYKGRFQASRVVTLFPGEWWRENNIPVVRAELICLKDGYRAPGEVLI